MLLKIIVTNFLLNRQSGYTLVETAGVQVPLTSPQANNLNIDSLLPCTLPTNPLLNFESSSSNYILNHYPYFNKIAS